MAWKQHLRVDINTLQERKAENPIFRRQLDRLEHMLSISAHKLRYLEQIKKLLLHEEVISKRELDSGPMKFHNNMITEPIST